MTFVSLLVVYVFLVCVQAVNNEDQLQINPGSATGAYSTFSQAVQPSFVLMDLDGSKVSKHEQAAAAAA